ncbi:MAG: sulfoxide reductase heme-binding subunit YedZ [Pseudomonadales bacterium]|nr:sulfoxide reductase heme-binding subunit YedZ [Pseudomonadales bacterium]
MKKLPRAAIKSLIYVIALLPLLQLVLGVRSDSLGPHPGEAIMEQLGLAALWLLIATLACSPLRRLTGSAEPLRFRRLLGLFCFFYACLHLLAFSILIVGFDWQQLLQEFSERGYIVAGLAAILCMLPLALTSTRGWQRRLGARWKTLHQLVYLAAIFVLVHLWWQVRSDYGEALLYTVLLGGLLLSRAATRLIHR